MHQHIFLDIETLRDQREGALEYHRGRVKVDKRLRDPYKIAERIETGAEEMWAKTSLDGGYGEIYCVCWAIDDAPVESISRRSQLSERELLQILNDTLPMSLGHEGDARRPTYVGHNIDFDLRFLRHRFVVHGIRPAFYLPHNVKPWSSDAVFDTMYEWTGDRNKYISCAELCSILGIQKDVNDIDGSQVWDAYVAGRHEEITVHCELDVERVREIWKRLTFRAAS